MNETSSRATEGGPVRHMVLFIAEGEPNSLEAHRNLQKICEEEPDCEFELQLVNVLEDYQTALEHGVLVTPCLILLEPSPRVSIVGTLKDPQKVRAALRLSTE